MAQPQQPPKQAEPYDEAEDKRLHPRSIAILTPLFKELFQLNENYKTYYKFIKEKNSSIGGVEETCRPYADGAINTVKTVSKIIREFSTASAQIKAMERQISEIEGEKASKDAEIEGLSQQFQASAAKTVNLEKSVGESEAKLKKNEELLAANAAQIAQHTTDAEALKARLHELDGQHREKSAAHAESERLLALERAGLAKLQQEKDALTAKHSEISTAAATQQAALDRSQRDLAAVRAEKSAIEAARASANARVQTNFEAYEKEKAKNDDAERKLALKEAEVVRLSEELNAAAALNATKQAELKAANEALAASEQDKQNLDAAIKKLQTETASYEAKLKPRLYELPPEDEDDGMGGGSSNRRTRQKRRRNRKTRR